MSHYGTQSGQDTYELQARVARLERLANDLAGKIGGVIQNQGLTYPPPGAGGDNASGIGFANGDIGPGSGTGTSYGAGSIFFAQDSGTALTATSDTLAVKNYHDKKFLSGAVVKWEYLLGSYWVTDVGRCTDLA